MSDNHLILVLGMHRSGTSAITKGLEVLGVDLGQNLMPPVENINEKGFFEDLDVNALNMELMWALGHDWNTSAPLSREELTESAISGEFLLRGVDLLRKKLHNSKCFGLKDPRIARLLPFWQNVFEHLKCRVSYIIAYRNPLSVARSLSKRDGMAAEKAYYLWFEHMLLSLTLTRGARRVVVDFDRVMEDPASQLKRIADNLGLPFDPNNQLLIDYLESFLEKKLQHHRFGNSDLLLDEATNSPIIKLNDLLSDMAGDVMSIDSDEVESYLSHANGQLDVDRPKLNYIKSIESDLVRAHQMVSGRDAQITELNSALAEREARLESMAKRIEALEASASWRLTAPLRLLFRVLRACTERFSLISGMIVRVFRYAFNPVLRQKAVNSFSRMWLDWRGRYRVVDLPELSWLLEKLEINIPADHVTARLGRYLTKEEESVSRDCLYRLRSASSKSSSSVIRASDIGLQADSVHDRRRVLFICGEFPNPTHGGGGRVADFVKVLSENNDVYVGAWYDPSRDSEAFASLKPLCKGLLRLSLEDLEAGCPDKLMDLIDHVPADVVHYEWPRSLNSFDRRLGRQHIYTHMEVVSCSLWMDLHRLEPLSPDWLNRMARLLVMLEVETLEAEKADAQIVVTAKDGEFLARFARDQTFYVVNHGINHGEFNLPDRPSEPCSLVFMGNFIHPPNVDAVHWFMQEVRPRILVAMPDVRLWLVGAHPPTTIRQHHDGLGVVVTGHVPDVRSYTQKATVCIAPLISGAGLRTKVVQYAALRRPCVATSIAVEDLGFMDGRDVFVADSAETFAERVIELLKNPGRASAMAVSARNRAMSVYDNQLIARDHLGRLYQWLDGHEEQP